MIEETKRFEATDEQAKLAAQNIWYKNKILWVCLAVPLFSLFMGFVTLWVAIGSGKSAVLDGYYKEGFAPKQVAKSALARDVRGEVVGGVLVITDPSGVTQNQTLFLKLEHPTLEAEDQLFELKGKYEGGVGRYPLNPAVLEMLKQHWYLRVYDQSQQWQIKGQAHPLKSGVVLEA